MKKKEEEEEGKNEKKTSATMGLHDLSNYRDGASPRPLRWGK